MDILGGFEYYATINDAIMSNLVHMCFHYLAYDYIVTKYE